MNSKLMISFYPKLFSHEFKIYNLFLSINFYVYSLLIFLLISFLFYSLYWTLSAPQTSWPRHHLTSVTFLYSKPFNTV